MSRQIVTLDDKQHHMTMTPVGRLVLQMAVPSILSMLITATYNVVDAMFIGRLSTEATAGIGISFAYQAFIQAVGFFFGHGSGNYISHQLGARHYDRAVKMASVGFVLSFAVGVVGAVLSLLFLHQLVMLLGATPTVAPYACDYLRYIVIATPVMMTSFTLNNQLRLQGNAHLGTIGIGAGALLNIVLDPLFIFAMDMGVAGASLATAVSQLCSWLLLLRATRREGSVHIDLRQSMPTRELLIEIGRCGLPSLCRQLLLSLGGIFLNYTAVMYALPGTKDASLAAFSVVTRVMMFSFSVVLGLCQGFQPVCGFNYGAGCYGRVRQAFRFTIKVGTIFLIVIASVGYVFAPEVISFFRSEDPLLIEIGSRAMRWQCLAFPLVCLCTATNMIFQNLGYTFRASLLGSARQGLCLVPVLWVLPKMIGFQGVEMAQAVSDVLTFAISLPQAVWISQRLRRMTDVQ